MGKTDACAKCGNRTITNGTCDACGNPIDRKSANLTSIDASKKDTANGGVLPMRRDASARAVRPAYLINALTNEKHALSQSVSKIGRDQSNNISIRSDHYISRHHAWVLQMNGGYWLEDLGSTNGTLLNGMVLTDRRQVFTGDRLTFGKTEFVFSLE